MTASPDPAAGQGGAGNKRVRQQTEVLFVAQILGLHKLVKNFGGQKLADRFDLHVLKAANNVQAPLILNKGKVRDIKADLPLSVYAQVMQEAMNFATTVAGKRLVNERIHVIIDGLENLTGKGFHETAFRFGLTRSH